MPEHLGGADALAAGLGHGAQEVLALELAQRHVQRTDLGETGGRPRRCGCCWR
jgi:hypothetical protein